MRQTTLAPPRKKAKVLTQKVPKTKQTKLIRIYHEDGIKFKLVSEHKSKEIARKESLKIRKLGYYSRVKHFYDSKGKVVNFGVLQSVKKRQAQPVKKTIKKKMSIHPYTELGLKPKKVNLKRKYLYHAVSQKNYKKELNGIEPPVFVATEPNIAKEIVKLVHMDNNPKVLKINVEGLPIYKDLYWEKQDMEFKKGFKSEEEEALAEIYKDMSEHLRKPSENKIFYIPKRVSKSRINVKTPTKKAPVKKKTTTKSKRSLNQMKKLISNSYLVWNEKPEQEPMSIEGSVMDEYRIAMLATVKAFNKHHLSKLFMEGHKREHYEYVIISNKADFAFYSFKKGGDMYIKSWIDLALRHLDNPQIYYRYHKTKEFPLLIKGKEYVLVLSPRVKEKIKDYLTISRKRYLELKKLTKKELIAKIYNKVIVKQYVLSNSTKDDVIYLILQQEELDDRKFGEDRVFNLKMDFHFAKENITGIDLGFSCDKKVKKTKLVLTNNKNAFYRRSDNTVNFGLKYLEKMNRRLVRMELVHELIHACGLPHRYGQLEYYSNIFKDKFSPEIMKKIGFQPPTKNDFEKYRGEIKKVMEAEYYEKQENAKYIISCPDCDFEAYRMKKSKITTTPQHYVCPKCNKLGLKSRMVR